MKSNPVQRPSGRLARLAGDNRRMVGKLIVIALAMFAFGYALVPIYRSICDALGINVLSLAELNLPGAAGARSASNTQVDRSRTITVEFDANARGPWDFKPALRSIEVHPGEMATVMYEFRNRQPRAMTAQAIPSYAPKQASPYFDKLECFCFNQYTLAAGREQAVAGGLRDRSEAAEGRDDDHAVLYLLRGRRRGAACARFGGSGRQRSGS